jgi:hypothetical protein
MTIGLLVVSRLFEKVERQIRKDFDDRNWKKVPLKSNAWEPTYWDNQDWPILF